MLADLLDQPRLSVISAGSDIEMHAISGKLARPIPVEGRADLEAALCGLLAHGRAGTAKTLDLIAHSTAHASLLMLGDWVIDATSSVVTAFFRELADHGVLARLGIHSVRLLGCATASSDHGKWTQCALADILGVEVYGTTGPLLASHYNADGFADERRYLLVSASQLRSHATVTRPNSNAQPQAHVLDVDAIPAHPLASRPWPVHVVTGEEARELLSLIRRGEGTTMPSLQATPTCELALPSATAGRYHTLEVLLDGELVRAHGIVYPVADPAELRKVVAYATRR